VSEFVLHKVSMVSSPNLRQSKVRKGCNSISFYSLLETTLCFPGGAAPFLAEVWELW